MLSLVKAGLAVGCAVIVAGCAAQEKTGPTAKAPDVAVSCIAVLPVRAAVDMDEPMTGAETKNLENGAAILDGLLKEALRNRKDVRFLSARQVESVTGAGEPAGIEQGRSLAGQVSCNAILETTLSRYEHRVGGQYGVKEPAAVTFDYRLYEVEGGRVLCHGRFDEEQQSVMETLLTLGKASSRGFSWITAEQLMREGLKEKLDQCGYFLDR